MSRWLARVVVHCSAWIAPREQRARWREEWIAEIENDPRSHFSRVLGAPRDALAMRRLERQRRTRGGATLDQWLSDTRYTLRLLVRSPGYVAVVTLGLGAGLTTTITMYSAANSALHGQLPGIADRESLARIEPFFDSTDRSAARLDMPTLDDFEILRAGHGPRILDVAAQGIAWVNVRTNDADVDNTRAIFASATLFQMLGTQPVIGRVLGPDDNRPDSSAVLISHRLWQRRFQGRTDVIGQHLLVGGRVMQIAGVVPPRFEGVSASWRAEAYVLGGTDIWMPLALQRDWPGALSWVTVAARLAPGITRADARADLAQLGPALVALHPAPGRRVTIHVWDFVFGFMAEDFLNVSGILLALLSFPLAVLVIACANVANLRFSRAAARTQEWSVRLSLGATRGQLIRLLAIEAAIVTMLSLFVAWVGVRVLIAQFGSRYLASTVAVDWRVATFSVLIAGAAVVLSGLWPASLAMRRATASGLKHTNAAGGPVHSRLRATLVVVQIAVSLALLAIGSLFTRSVQFAGEHHDARFDRLITAELGFREPVFDGPRANAFMTTLLARLEQDSRFSAVGVSDSRIGGGRSHAILSAVRPETGRRAVEVAAVSPGWFDAMALPALVGRTLTTRDGPNVAVVNESVARMIADGSPIGMTLTLSRDNVTPIETRSMEIVGVVADTTRVWRDQHKAVPYAYTRLTAPLPTELTLFAREAHDGDLVPALRGRIADIDPVGPWMALGRASTVLEERASAQREMAVAVTSIGVLALGLAAGGLFAVMAYAVSLRTREIGVRLALGARPFDIHRLVMFETLRLAAIGLFAGLLVAIPLAQGFRFMFLGVSPIDPITIIGLSVLFGVIALTAGALPARRAAAVDPVTALRAD